MILAINRTTTDYRYWTLGLFASLASFSSSVIGSYGNVEYGCSAALALLFFWGLLRAEEEIVD